MSLRLVFAVVVVAACGGDDGGQTGSGFCEYGGRTYELGQTWPTGDGCNACSCTTGGAACTERACADAGIVDPMSCMPTSGCPDGPACGTICCAVGERCVNGSCKCGSAAACSLGNTCEAAGPVGGDACGSICCGAIGPCPQ